MKFSELSESAKEHAINKWRENGLDYEWWDVIYDDAKRIGALMGIEVEQIYFSGFWSQGDGACFEGSYSYVKEAAKAVREYAPQDAELHRIARELQTAQRRNFYKLRADCKQRGHYNHSGCMSVSVEHTEDNYRGIGTAEGDIIQCLRDFADWIYRSLEKDYEYLTSDEVIAETIKANEYEFDEEGDME